MSATAWAIQEDKLRAMLAVLELRAEGKRIPQAEIDRVKAQNRNPVAKSAGTIAVLPLYGVVAQRMNVMTEASGGTSTEKFGAMFDEAMRRKDVSAIVIDVDSPGGAVEGVSELAAKVFAGRGQKPIVAIANSLMASAAYWIASAADEIVMAPVAQVGSIGVFTVHMDASQAYQDEGLRATIISAGKYKTEGNEFEPLSEEARAAVQRTVDDIYGMFVSDVAKHRGTNANAVKSGYGQGRALVGKMAIAAGLADRIDTLDGVLTRLGAGKSGKRSAMLSLFREDHAGEELVAGGTEITIGAEHALISRQLGFSAAAPHNTMYLTVPKKDKDSEATMAKKKEEADDFESRSGEDECAMCGAELDDNGECPNGHPQPDDEDDEEDGDEPADNQSRRKAEGAARRSASHPHRQAPPARRATVSTPTAPQNGANYVDFLDLAAAHDKSTADVKGWIEAGMTREQVMGSLLNEKRSAARPIVSVGEDRATLKPWRCIGEQLMAVVQQGRTGRMDPRLARTAPGRIFAGAADGMDESVGSEGGFFIQPELLPEVIDPVYKDDPILSRVTRVPIGSNTNGVKYNVADETSRVTGSRWGGIEMYWLSEAGTYTSSKPKLRLFELNLKKLIGLAYLTEELTLDAPAAESLLTRAFQAELSFMLRAAIWTGIGGGQPLGFMNSGALQTVAIEGSQTIANSNLYMSLNVTKMLMAIPSSLWSQVIWLYQQELLPYLMNASIAGSSAGAAVPIFVPIGGFINRPFDLILGRPAFPSELASAVGTPGDIVAIVPSQYHLGEKGGAMLAQSIHVKFLTDELTLRWTYRVDGAPVWRVPVTPYKGAVARSPFVALATRS
jgi:HK97 family phage major capsid protein